MKTRLVVSPDELSWKELEEAKWAPDHLAPDPRRQLFGIMSVTLCNCVTSNLDRPASGTNGNKKLAWTVSLLTAETVGTFGALLEDRYSLTRTYINAGEGVSMHQACQLMMRIIFGFTPVPRNRNTAISKKVLELSWYIGYG